MSRRMTDAGAQLGAALDQLQRALFELLLPAAEAIAGAIVRLLDGRRAARRRRDLDAIGRAVTEGMAGGLDAGRQLGTISIEILPDLSRFEAALQLDRAQPNAGRRPLDAEQLAGVFGVPLAALSPAGELPAVERPPAGYAEIGPASPWQLTAQLRDGSSVEVHPSHELAGDVQRVECTRCGWCSCCDPWQQVAAPCDVS